MRWEALPAFHPGDPGSLHAHGVADALTLSVCDLSVWDLSVCDRCLAGAR
jgi:hypothetical protein